MFLFSRFCFLIAVLVCPALLAAEPKKPNVILILTDDQAVDTIAAANVWGVDSSVIQTPNMDRLLREGTSFTHCYNPGAWLGAVCVASRSMLNTGKFLWYCRDAEKSRFKDLVDTKRFWSQRMHDAGYETFMLGKWHVEAPPEELFDHVIHLRPGMAPTVKAAYQRPVEGKEDGWKPWDTRNGGYWKGGKHWSEVLADDATASIKLAATAQKPFFMYLAFNAPHDPRQSPREFIDRYPLDKVPVPENFLPENPHLDAMGLGPKGPKGMRDENLAPYPRTPFAVRTHRREYQAMVTHVDVQIGRILDALDQAGVSDHTHVILTSDHGLALGRHGLLGKQNLYEHSLRVPFVIRGPGIPENKSISTRIYLQDAMPTVLEVAGADSNGLDFKSLFPLIRGGGMDQSPAIYAAYAPDRQRAVIDGNLKLILYPEDHTQLLFDLEKDPLEMNPLADRLADKKRLFRRLLDLQKQLGDPLDLRPSFPDLNPDS